MFAWIVAAAVVLIIGLVDASHGISEVQKAKGHLSASELVSQGPVSDLRVARGDFASAQGLLNSPLLAPFEVLPVIGRQLRSVQDLSTAAETTTRIGIQAMDSVRAVLDQPHRGGPDRVSTLRRLSSLASSTEAQLARIDTGPSNALFAPIATRRTDFVNELDQVRTRLTHASEVANVTAGILQGPETYLLLMANPAEMRAGSGMFLEAGVVTSHDGEVQLSGMVPTGSIPLAPGAVSVGGDLEARWGWLHPGVDWRNLGLTPQFDVNAPLAASMWQTATGQHVDGVLEIDVQALQQFLTVTGPVTLDDGRVVGAADVVSFLIHDQYAGLSYAQTPAQAQAQQARQDELGDLARGALSALENESLNLKTLANAMTGVTQGRHILLWSDAPSAEAAWQEGGVAGRLTSDSVMVAVMNGGGNKLDQYVTVHCALTFVRHGGETSATLSVVAHNRTPTGQSQFIAGPYPGLGTVYGEYAGFVAVNLPSDAYRVVLSGSPTIAEGPEGPTTVVAGSLDLKKGSSEKIVVRFDLPSSGSLNVLPSARLAPATWTYPGGSTTDAAPFAITW